jgi:hypothetical protein
MSVYSSIINAPNAAIAAPTDVNGTVTSLDLSAAATHVEPENMYVLSAAGAFDLRNTIAHAIWVAQGSPVAPTAVSLNHLDAASDAIGVALIRYEFLQLWSHTDLGADLTLRASDGISAIKWNATAGGVNLVATADQVWEMYVTDPSARVRMICDPQLSLLAIIMNALHRLKFLGHNHFTEEGKKRGSETYKLLGVAGAARIAFEDSMARIGHDLWHFIPDTQLQQIAGALVGESPAVVDAGYDYMGSVVPADGVELHTLLSMPQSATDRYPPGTVGVSALILGLELLVAMVDTIATKASSFNDGGISPAANALKAVIAEEDLERDVVLELRTSLTDVIAFAYGFGAAFNDMTDFLEKYKSLTALSERSYLRANRGKLLGKWVKELSADSAGMLASVNTALATIATALTNATATIIAAIPAAVIPAAVAGVVEIYSVEEEAAQRALDEARRSADLAALQV